MKYAKWIAFITITSLVLMTSVNVKSVNLDIPHRVSYSYLRRGKK